VVNANLYAPTKATNLLKYLREGASLHFKDRDPDPLPSLASSWCRNLPSSVTEEQQVKILKDIKDEVTLGRRAGPFTSCPSPLLCVSPLGTTPKKNTTKLRIIHHLSYPRSGSRPSVNSLIGDLECKLLKFDDTLKAVAKAGRGCLLAKFDIKDAFKLIPVRPNLQLALGMFIFGYYFVERVLPFGLKSAPAIFEWFSSAIEAIIKFKGINTFFHYLDDFLLLTFSNVANVQYELVLSTFKYLGVPLSEPKLAPPSTRIEFLGRIIDTDKMTAELPEDKLIRYRENARRLAQKGEASVDELATVFGQLVWAASVIQHGRKFYSNIGQDKCRAEELQLLAWDEGKDPNFLHPLSAASIQELYWWANFMEQWNGISMIKPVIPEDCVLFTDACQTGMGAYLVGPTSCKYISHVWNSTELAQSKRAKSISMPFLELLALTIAVGVWAEDLRGRSVLIRSDCKAAVDVISQGYAHEGRMTMLLRRLTFIEASHDIFTTVLHIPGIYNQTADVLSRLTDCDTDSDIDFDELFCCQQVIEDLAKGKQLLRSEYRALPKEIWTNFMRRTQRTH